jgi:phosphopantetheine adenylyltransferase
MENFNKFSKTIYSGLDSDELEEKYKLEDIDDFMREKDIKENIEEIKSHQKESSDLINRSLKK